MLFHIKEDKENTYKKQKGEYGSKNEQCDDHIIQVPDDE